LVGSDLKIDPPHSPAPSIWLPVKNVGKTPALNLSFDSKIYFYEETVPSMSHKLGFIAPTDVANFRIAILSNTRMEDFGERISVTISYSTHVGGSGLIKQKFEKIGESWINKESDYSFTLST
jgi:hypothetical protein